MCEHHKHNSKVYLPVRSGVSLEKCLEECNNLKNAAVWNTEVCDIVPTAVCNMTGIPMDIIQSDSQTEYIRLVPFTDVTREDALVGQFNTSEFHLARSCVPGMEHFDTRANP